MFRLEIILGPMFSGKSTELIRRVGRYEAINKNVLLVNHSLDSRTDESVKTHSNIKKNALKVTNIMDLFPLDTEIDVIGIDEAQFFSDLKEFILTCEKFAYSKSKKIIIIIAGLDGDYKRHPFGEILDCIPLCDEVIKLSAMCMYKKNGSPAIFTKRKEFENTSNEVTLIGGQESYSAVCRDSYLK